MTAKKTLSTPDFGTLNDAVFAYEKARGAEAAERLRDTIATLARAERELESRYRFGLAWIALNDEPTCLKVKTVAEFTSTLLLADTFRKTPAAVAKEIVAIRKTEAAKSKVTS